MLLAYTRVTNFWHIFGHGNMGRLIHVMVYTRVYMVIHILDLVSNYSALVISHLPVGVVHFVCIDKTIKVMRR